MVGRVLTRETGRLDSELTSTSAGLWDSDDPIEPTVVDRGLSLTLAPFIKSCCIPLSNCGAKVVERNCSGARLKSKA